MKAFPISAEARTKTGSRHCRHLRAAGRIPANLYGVTGEERINKLLSVPAYEVMQAVDQLASVLEVTWEGKTELVHLSEVQRDQFGDDIVHVDLHMIDANKPMHGVVPVHTKGEAKGTREGGALRIEVHELEVEALPRQMPRDIVIRVDDLGLGQALHVSDLELPEGVKALTPAELVVVHVVMPEEEAEPTEEGEGGATEPELIGGKPEASE